MNLTCLSLYKLICDNDSSKLNLGVNEMLELITVIMIAAAFYFLGVKSNNSQLTIAKQKEATMSTTYPSFCPDYKGALKELSKLGLKGKAKKDRRIGYCVKMSCDLDGQWFIPESKGLSKIGNRYYLPLAKLPKTKNILSIIENKMNVDISRIGRISVSENGVYKVDPENTLIKLS